MCDLSVADGFVEINENLGDMIKYVANEPSVGLYYIQQHVQNAVPNVVRLKNNLTEMSNDMSLHTEDIEDSIAMTKTMKDCGFPIIDEMIRDIKMSLTMTSSKHPIRGVIKDDGEKPGSYFSSVFRSAKEKAVNLAWPQQEPKEVAGNSSDNTLPDEADELPLSSEVKNEVLEECNGSNDVKNGQLLFAESGFDEFRAKKEALLEEWLTSSGSFL
ncbi:hypothetical protein RND81_03G190000 [Saponaria officinalis]|uniref:Uncharacterized protein n=1 Tax=Saponaria officinalis TaxID=3572 RepID=A0AAW1M1E3_SAPOF